MTNPYQPPTEKPKPEQQRRPDPPRMLAEKIWMAVVAVVLFALIWWSVAPVVNAAR